MVVPAYIEPRLPNLVDLAPTGERWIHEIKHDGYRLAVRIHSGDVRLLSRRGLNWTSRFPFVDQAARELLQKSVYIDGEVVIDGADGISDWPAPHACASAGRCPGASLWAFDLLFLGGKDLRALPLVERKQMLAEILALLSGGIRYVEFLEGDGPTVFEHACALGLEGIVSKLRDRYRSGKSDAWRKTKCEQRSEFVVEGFIPNSGNKRAVGALVLAELIGDELKPAGKVGTGWTMKVAAELAAALELIVQRDAPFAKQPVGKAFPGVRWVRPLVTVNVAYRGRTGDGLLRHPSFKAVVGIR
ncbi:non-homologous end-joining DNA ligase [Rhizobium mongolense]